MKSLAKMTSKVEPSALVPKNNDEEEGSSEGKTTEVKKPEPEPESSEESIRLTVKFTVEIFYVELVDYEYSWKTLQIAIKPDGRIKFRSDNDEKYTNIQILKFDYKNSFVGKTVRTANLPLKPERVHETPKEDKFILLPRCRGSHGAFMPQEQWKYDLCIFFLSYTDIVKFVEYIEDNVLPDGEKLFKDEVLEEYNRIVSLSREEKN